MISSLLKLSVDTKHMTMAPNDSLAAALRAREEELNSVGAGAASMGSQSVASLVSEARDSIGKEDVSSGGDRGSVRHNAKEELSSAGPGSAQHSVVSGAQPAKEHSSGGPGSAQHSIASGAQASKDNSSHDKQDSRVLDSQSDSDIKSALGASDSGTNSRAGSGTAGGVSAATTTGLQDKLIRMKNKVEETKHTINHKVDKVIRLKEKEVAELKRELEKTRQWALRMQRERDKLEAQTAGKHVLLEHQEVMQRQAQAVAKEAKAEVFEAEVAKQEAELAGQKERADKDASLELLRCQIGQAKDALQKVKYVAQEGYTSAEIIDKVDQQLQNVEEMSNFRLNLCGISKEGRPAPNLSMPNKLPGRQGPKARNIAAQLQSIDEDDLANIEIDDVNFDNQSRVAQSICVSSDAGEADMFRTLDVGGNDLQARATLSVLENMLQKERAVKGDIRQEKVDLAIEAAEQQEQIEMLRKKVSYYIECEYAEARTKDELKSELVGEMIDNSKTQALLIERDAKLADKVVEENLTIERMEEQVALSKETLRLANLRIEDLKVELEHCTLRYEKQIARLEREVQEAQGCAGATDGNEDGTLSASLSYYKNLVDELQEELALTKDKLMAVQVENQIRFDEQKNQYDADAAEAVCKHKYDMEVLKTEHLKADHRTSTDSSAQPQIPERTSASRVIGDKFESLFQACFQGVDNLAGAFLGQLDDQQPGKSCAELLWSLLSTTLNLVVMSCSTSTLVVQQMSLEAFKLLGEGLPGGMIFQRMNSSTQAAMARRTIISRNVAKTTDIMSWCELGSFEFTGPTNKTFQAKMLAVDFALEHARDIEDVLYIILLPEVNRTMNLGSAKGLTSATRSVQSEDDINASDSVSVSGGSGSGQHRTTLRGTRR
eukprot:TRINITY_DN2368_c0_g1_i2.p1 TRINITY_DN2368_c0_g1~~TRINITY_DN2368_c0_g1_i2.p1  ORF type:complete len:891 (-),score=230.98 TRINITY_DN2368_c0_g1_i2:262-2934(-)